MVTVVRGVVKDYDWGIVDGLAPWCGGPTGRPQAELWYGAHPSGPSPILTSARVTDAESASAQAVNSPGAHLGDVLDSQEVPLLVKLLAAAQPLSVQVHPRAEQAMRRWSDQQSAGALPILADGNEKTELIVAIEPFEAFVGWRPVADAVAILSHIPVAADAAGLLSAGDRVAAIRSLLAAVDLNGAVAMLPGAAGAAGLSSSECAAFETVANIYPGDRGALLTALLSHVSLSVGSAIYVPAGVPHSYIQGLGLEVMTTSDNVLRLGLTSKPIFIEEAIEALDLEAVPQVIRVAPGELIAPSDAPFEVLLGVRLPGSAAEAAVHPEHPARAIMGAGRFRLCLAIEGSAEVMTDSATVHLSPGSAAVLSREESAATVSSTGLVALVSDRAFSESGVSIREH